MRKLFVLLLVLFSLSVAGAALAADPHDPVKSDDVVGGGGGGCSASAVAPPLAGLLLGVPLVLLLRRR